MTPAQRRVHRDLSAAARPMVPWITAAAVGGAMIARGDRLDPFTFVFAMVLAWCVASVRASGLLRSKQPAPGLHDEIDRETGVGNARAALALIERETSRAASHGSLFSVIVLDIGRDTLSRLSPRRSSRVLSDLLRGIAEDVRSSDRVCRVATSDRELIVIVLPDTGAGGARLFTNRLLPHVQQRLAGEGGRSVDQPLRAEVVTAPDEGVAVERLQRRLRVLVGTEELVLGDGARRRRGPRRAHQGPSSTGANDPLAGSAVSLASRGDR